MLTHFFCNICKTLNRFIHSHNIETIIPNDAQRTLIHDVIYEELVKGIVKDESRKVYLEIMNDLMGRGAEGILLACTEINLLVSKENTNHLLFDTPKYMPQKQQNWQ